MISFWSIHVVFTVQFSVLFIKSEFDHFLHKPLERAPQPSAGMPLHLAFIGVSNLIFSHVTMDTEFQPNSSRQSASKNVRPSKLDPFQAGHFLFVYPEISSFLCFVKFLWIFHPNKLPFLCDSKNPLLTCHSALITFFQRHSPLYLTLIEGKNHISLIFKFPVPNISFFNEYH